LKSNGSHTKVTLHWGRLVKLTKLDAGRHQLVTAINLFFSNRDPISTYSLATNAWEVIDVLCNQSNVDSISNETRGRIIGQNKDLKYDYINSPYRNFFKHADKDPDAILEGFDDTKCDPILFLASEDYIRLNQASPLEMQVFQLWYLALYTDKVSHEDLDRIKASIAVIFPDIKNLDRAAQKEFGLQQLLAAKSDPELLSDPLVQAS
jgi:hypothetical protein